MLDEISGGVPGETKIEGRACVRVLVFWRYSRRPFSLNDANFSIPREAFLYLQISLDTMNSSISLPLFSVTFQR